MQFDGYTALIGLVLLGRARGSPVASTPAITPSPTSTSTDTGIFTSGSPTACYNTDFVGAILGAYSGLSTDPALQCQCLTQISDWLYTTNPGTHTITRSIGTGVLTETETISGDVTTIVTEAVNVETYTVTENNVGADGDFWYGSATPPCCYSCSVAAATVEIFYWQTPAPTDLVTSFVSNDVTYVSPSVYIGFSSLYAYDYCGTVGDAFTNTTIAFDQSELSTVQFVPQTSSYNVTQDVGTTVTTYVTTTTYYTSTTPAPLNYEVLGQNCSTIAGYTYVPGNPSAADIFATYDPCHPIIVVPDRIRSLQPSWNTCGSNAIGGFYDPPYPLTSASGLLPATTSTSDLPTTTSASPGSTATSIPTQTVTTPLPDQEPTSTAPASETNTATETQRSTNPASDQQSTAIAPESETNVASETQPATNPASDQKYTSTAPASETNAAPQPATNSASDQQPTSIVPVSETNAATQTQPATNPATSTVPETGSGSPSTAASSGGLGSSSGTGTGSYSGSGTSSSGSTSSGSGSGSPSSSGPGSGGSTGGSGSGSGSGTGSSSSSISGTSKGTSTSTSTSPLYTGAASRSGLAIHTGGLAGLVLLALYL